MELEELDGFIRRELEQYQGANQRKELQTTTREACRNTEA